MQVRDGVLKSLEDRAQREADRRAARSARAPLGRRRSLPAARTIRARVARAVHRFPSGAGPRGGEALAVTRGARRRRQSANAAGSTPPIPARTPRSPPSAAPCAEAVEETLQWLISGVKAYGAAAAVFALDRVTKWVVERRVSFTDTWPVIPGFFDIVRSQNRGVAFGMFNDSNSSGAPPCWSLVSAAAVVVVSAMLWNARRLDRLVALGPGADSGRRGGQCVRPHRCRGA